VVLDVCLEPAQAQRIRKLDEIGDKLVSPAVPVSQEKYILGEDAPSEWIGENGSRKKKVVTEEVHQREIQVRAKSETGLINHRPRPSSHEVAEAKSQE